MHKLLGKRALLADITPKPPIEERSDQGKICRIEDHTKPKQAKLKNGVNLAFVELGQKKNDMSAYFSVALTDRQRECLSLRFEYDLSVTDIASLLGLSRKTVDEHLVAGQKRLQKAKGRQRWQKNRAKTNPGQFD
jgi:predicted DNA-binding protein YlxM (UPF0122 family)